MTYLFDFDGTLVDSMPTFVSVMLRILDERGIKYGDGIVKTITPLGYQGTAEHFTTLGAKEEKDELVRLMKEYAKEAYETTVPLKAGVYDTLIKLHERGDSLNVLTASPHAMLDPCLKRVGVYDLFDNVWSSDDFGLPKSTPQIYRFAARRLGCDVGDVIFVDDNIGAVRTAAAAGMRAYGIYDDSSADSEAEMRGVAERYIKNFSELLS